LTSAIRKASVSDEGTVVVEVPPVHQLRLSTILKRTWFETSSFVTMALPLMVLGSMVLKALAVGGVLSRVLP